MKITQLDGNYNYPLLKKIIFNNKRARLLQPQFYNPQTNITGAYAHAARYTKKNFNCR